MRWPTLPAHRAMLRRIRNLIDCALTHLGVCRMDMSPVHYGRGSCLVSYASEAEAQVRARRTRNRRRRRRRRGRRQCRETEVAAEAGRESTVG